MKPDARAGATFSPDRTYRYTLWRAWSATKPRLAFIMLNPSTADEHVLDPTVRRCVAYAKGWDYGSVEVGNLYALRSTDPNAPYTHPSPIGEGNDEALVGIQRRASRLIAAWGNHGAHQGRGDHVADLLAQHGPVHVPVLTRTGHPAHPLYLRADLQPERWR